MALFSKRDKEKPGKGGGGAAKSDTRAASNGAAPANALSWPAILPERPPRSRRTLASLGEIVAVLMRSPRYRTATLAYVQALVAPAIAAGQFVVANAHDKARGVSAPVALALWANVSAEVDQRLSSLPSEQPIMLRPQDWRSGDITWLIALVGDQRMAQPLLKALQQKTLKGRAIKARVRDKDGKVSVQAVAAATLMPEHLAP